MVRKMKAVIRLALSCAMVFPLIASGELQLRGLMQVAETPAVKPAMVWSQGEEETDKIDVLIVFDNTAAAWVGRSEFASRKAFATAAVADMNEGLAYTGLDRFFTFRLAGCGTIDFDFSGYDPAWVPEMPSALKSLRNREKKIVQAIMDARDRMKADVVAILVDGYPEGFFGSSQNLLPDYLDPEHIGKAIDRAYCTCKIDSVFERHTLLHEIGHVMGAGHASGYSLCDYAKAHDFSIAGEFGTTVMGSPDGEPPRVRMPFFSSPLYHLLLEDTETGALYDSGVAVGTALNDNTRTLRETYALVANYRVARKIEGWQPDAPAPVPTVSIRSDDETSTAEIAKGAKVSTCRYVPRAFRVTASPAEDVSVKVTGLPKGMSFASGLISGVPTQTGTFAVKVTATNRNGKGTETTFSLQVSSYPVWARGVFDGFAVWNGGPVRATMTISSSAVITGALLIDGKTCRFSRAGLRWCGKDAKGRAALGVEVEAADGTGVSRTFDLIISREPYVDRKGKTLKSAEVTGADGVSWLVPNVWKRSDVAACKFPKAYKVRIDSSSSGSHGLGQGEYVDVKITSSTGSASYSGVVGGRKISGSLRLLRKGWDVSRRVEVADFPILDPSFRKIVRLRLTVSAAGKVTAMALDDVRELEVE